jgi:hypothetical protein
MSALRSDWKLPPRWSGPTSPCPICSLPWRRVSVERTSRSPAARGSLTWPAVSRPRQPRQPSFVRAEVDPSQMRWIKLPVRPQDRAQTKVDKQPVTGVLHDQAGCPSPSKRAPAAADAVTGRRDHFVRTRRKLKITTVVPAVLRPVANPFDDIERIVAQASHLAGYFPRFDYLGARQIVSDMIGRNARKICAPPIPHRLEIFVDGREHDLRNIFGRKHMRPISSDCAQQTLSRRVCRVIMGEADGIVVRLPLGHSPRLGGWGRQRVV